MGVETVVDTLGVMGEGGGGGGEGGERVLWFGG